MHDLAWNDGRLGHSGRYAEDFPNAETPNKVIATKDDLARANLFQGTRPKVIDLSRSLAGSSTDSGGKVGFHAGSGRVGMLSTEPRVSGRALSWSRR